MTDTAKVKAVFEKIVSIVPGYRSYASKENIRKNQRVLHSRMATYLVDTQHELSRFKQGAIADGDFDRVRRYASLHDQLVLWDTKINSLKKGYSAVFSTDLVSDTVLEEVLFNDLEMLESVKSLYEQALNSESHPDEDLLSQRLADLKRALARRSEIMGVERD